MSATAKNAKSASKKISSFSKSFIDGLRQGDKDNISQDLLDNVIRQQEAISDRRKSGRSIVEVYNPSQEIHGWHNLHTVINIVSDDMVFFIDSVTAYVAEKSYLIEQILHPRVYKKGAGKNITYLDKKTAKSEGVRGEMHMFIQLNRRLTEDQMKEIQQDLQEIIADTLLATRDWRLVRQTLNDARENLVQLPGQNKREYSEYKDFLQYIHDDNFTLLGCVEYKVTKKGKLSKLTKVAGSGHGLFSEDRKGEFLDETDKTRFVENLDARNDAPQLFITKLMRRSDVHRRVPVDCVVIRHFDSKGSLTGETHVVGLFTSVTYSRGIATVPYLWMKVENILNKAGFESGEHSGRALRHILEKYPRDELFQIEEAKLYRICMEILRLQERPRIALFMRPDVFGRTISCLVYIPRDRYDTRLRIRFSMILEEELGARFINFQSTVDDSPLVRASFTLSCDQEVKQKFDIEKIEKRLQTEGRNWSERLNDTLVERLENEDEAAVLAHRYGNAFPVSYKEAYQTRQAYHDIEKLEVVLQKDQADVDLYRPHGSGNNQVSLKLYSPHEAVPLSDILPILENMGMKVEAEYPHEVWPRDVKFPVWIQDFDASIVGSVENSINKEAIQEIRENFEDCLKGIWATEIENDSLNRLVLLAGMPWRDVVILRSYIRYMRQTKIPFSLPYMEQAATDYPIIA
ncbi:MAG TPA: NAD-glutamate dehydrogenase, partial [Alphaproteobacteria bacterium]|nr:NAD-glutamate dehydrogenase [Alphaproteobacteria bacterium]